MNPLFIVADSNGEIIDGLAIYEYSPPHSLTNKSCYIDENYIFHIKEFYNVDGYEVGNYEPYERYKISQEGKFEFCN